MSRRLVWLWNTSNWQVLSSASPSNLQLIAAPISGMSGNYTGSLTSNTTVVAYVYPKKWAIIHLRISSVSGTFASGQGLTIQLSWYNYTVTVNSTPITSPTMIDIVFTPQSTYAIINGTQVSLTFPFVPYANINLNISGTSPSFSVDGWVEYE